MHEVLGCLGCWVLFVAGPFVKVCCEEGWLINNQAHNGVGLWVVAGDGVVFVNPFYITAEGFEDWTKWHHGAAVVNNGALVALQGLAIYDDVNVCCLGALWRYA